MSEKAKRRWSQIHLSTAIVLMFVWGLVLPLNIIARPWYFDDHTHVTLVYQRGWPLRMNVGNENWSVVFLWKEESHQWMPSTDFNKSNAPQSYQGEWYVSAMLINSMLLGCITIIVAAILEAISRRRERGGLTEEPR